MLILATKEMLKSALEEQRPYQGDAFSILCMTLSSNMAFCFMEKDKVQGVISFGEINGRLYVYELVTLTPYQKQGIGKKLLLKVAVEASKKRIGIIELSPLSTSVSFYQKLGFTNQGYYTVTPKKLMRKIKQSFHLTSQEFSDMIKQFY